MTPENARLYQELGVKPDVLNADDVMRMVPGWRATASWSTAC